MTARKSVPSGVLPHRGRVGLVALMAGLSCAAATKPQVNDVSNCPEVVILLHGWWSNPLAMSRVEISLRSAGYQVVNVGYPSIWVPLQQTARYRLSRRLAKIVPSTAPRVHFVTHSMGALLLREYLKEHRPPNLGRIVMLGPPNQGSELADHFHSPVTRWIAGPNYQCLQTSNAACLTDNLAGAEIGIVAGDRSWLPAQKYLPVPNDGKVSVAATRLAGMTDHRIVHVSHSCLPWNRTVVRLIQAFLSTGKFEQETQNVLSESPERAGPK